MELQRELETETPVATTGRFIRVVERVTRRDIFPCIDAVAELAEQNNSTFITLTAEVQRAYHQGTRNLSYAPDAEYLGHHLPVQDINTFLKAVYFAGRANAPQKPVMPPCTVPVGLPVSIRYLTQSETNHQKG